MIAIRRRIRNSSGIQWRLLMVLLLGALLVQASIPRGYMPSVSSAGQPGLVFCGDNDALAALLEAETPGADESRSIPDHDESGFSACPFSSLAHLLTAQSPSSMTTRWGTSENLPPYRADPFHQKAADYLLPRPLSPPVLPI